MTGLKVSRSLESVRTGGADITCITGLSVEVKRKKRILPSDITSFWHQTVSQAEKEGDKPVLFMREDRGDWQIVVALGDLVEGIDKGQLPVTLDYYSFQEVYKEWRK